MSFSFSHGPVICFASDLRLAIMDQFDIGIDLVLFERDSWSVNFALYFKYYLMDLHRTWDNESL